MAITPLPGWQVDPNNPNAVIPISVESTTQIAPYFSSEKGQELVQNATDITTRLSPQPTSGTTETPKKETTKPPTGYSLEDVLLLTKDMTGWQRQPDGTYIPDEVALKNLGVEKTNTELDSSRAELDSALAKIKNFDVSNDPTLQGIMQSITSSWNSRIGEMERSNRSRTGAITQTGIRMGSRYTGGAGGTFGSLISGEEQAGIQRIADLEAQKNSALVEAKAAYESKMWTRYVKAAELAQEKYNSQLEAVKDLNDAQVKQDEKIQEERRKQTIGDSIYNSILESGGGDVTTIYQKLREQGIKVSPQEVSDILKQFLPEGKSDKDLPSDAKLFEWMKKTGQLEEGATIFDMWKAEQTAKSSKGVGQGNGGGGDISDLMFVMSALPARLKDSDAEKELIREYFADAKNRGLTPFKMIDELIGYRVDNPSPFSEGMRQFALGQNLDQMQTASLGRLINSGNFAQAIQLVENEAYKNARVQLGENFLSEAEVTFLTEKSNEIQKTLDDYGFFDAIGPFSGTLNDALGRLGRKKGAELKAKITFLTQEIQKRQAGSALTESEWQRILVPIVPLLTDKRGIFETKIKEGKNSALQRLNSERIQFQLPSIGEKELLNRYLRIPAYYSRESHDPLQVGLEADANNPLGI